MFFNIIVEGLFSFLSMVYTVSHVIINMLIY